MRGGKNRALQVPPIVPYKALGNFSKALYGTTGTCSARFFCPVMSKPLPAFTCRILYFCHKTKTEEITQANHNATTTVKPVNQLKRNAITLYMYPTKSAGKRSQASHKWLRFCFSWDNEVIFKPTPAIRDLRYFGTAESSCGYKLTSLLIYSP